MDLFERDREAEGQRGRETPADSALSTEPTAGLDPTTLEIRKQGETHSTDFATQASHLMCFHLHFLL